MMTVTGPAGAVFDRRSASLYWGEGTIRVAPASTPFRTNLRDGRTELEAGEFTVTVEPSGTRLTSRTGTLRVIPRSDPSFELEPGDSRGLRLDAVSTAPSAVSPSGQPFASTTIVLPGEDEVWPAGTGTPRK